MPSLESLLNSSHFTRAGSLYSLASAVVDGYLRGANSLQLDQAAIFPLEKHTPGGASLSSANFAASIRNAVTAAQDTGNGGFVLIPPGQWSVGDEDIEIVGAGRGNPVTLVGAGMDMTTLLYPTGYTGTAIKFIGTVPPATEFFYNGGMSNLSMQCETYDASNTGTGIHIEGTANMQFRNITVRNFTGGRCWKATRGTPDFTNQYTQFHNCTAAGGYINYDWTSVVNAQAYGLYSGSAVYRDFKVDDVKCSVYGGNMQGNPPIAVEMTGVGGCRFILYDYYWEGISAGSMTMFKCVAPSSTYNVLEVHGFHLGGAPNIFCDSESTNVLLDQIYSVGNANTILKARTCITTTLLGAGSPITTPSKFDLDSQSRDGLTCIEVGHTYVGGRHYTGRGVSLAGFAEGYEPSSPEAGDVIYNTGSLHPRVRSGSAWRDLAWNDEPINLTDLLAPYAAEIWDPSILSKVSLSSGAVVSITGLLNNTVASAPSAPQRPVWSAADDNFRGQPSFTCANASSGEFLGATLSPVIAAGSYPGIFIVGRVVTPKGGSGRCFLIELANAGLTSGMSISADDVNSPGHWGAVWGSGGLSAAAAIGAIDTKTHVMAAYSDPPSLGDLGIRYDLEAPTLTGPGAGGGSASDLVSVHLGAGWNSSAFEGGDVAIAYAAVLKSMVPASVMSRAISLARSRFGAYY